MLGAHPPTPPPRPLCPHTRAYVRGLLPRPLLSWRESEYREAGRVCVSIWAAPHGWPRACAKLGLPRGRTVQLHRQLPRPLQVQDGEASVVCLPDDHVYRPTGTSGWAMLSQLRQFLTPSPAPPPMSSPHLGAGNAPRLLCLCRAAVPASRSHPWGGGGGRGAVSRAGLRTPTRAAPHRTLVQAREKLGSGSGVCPGDSQLPEGADGHGCTLGSHTQCGGLSPVALLLQEAARGGHRHKEPRSCKLGASHVRTQGDDP